MAAKPLKLIMTRNYWSSRLHKFIRGGEDYQLICGPTKLDSVLLPTFLSEGIQELCISNPKLALIADAQTYRTQ